MHHISVCYHVFFAFDAQFNEIPGFDIYDPATGKFFWVDLKFVDGGKEVKPGTRGEGGKPFSWSDALAYDPELRLVLLNNSSARKVWAMRLDRRSLNVTEMGD